MEIKQTNKQKTRILLSARALISWQIPLQLKKTWISDKSAYSFCSLLNENTACTDLSPVVLMKAVKNPTELAGKNKIHS